MVITEDMAYWLRALASQLQEPELGSQHAHKEQDIHTNTLSPSSM